MLKATQFVCFVALILCVASCSGEEGDTDWDGPLGGNCGYVDNPGTCTGTADNTFTFEGTINGETVVNTGNILYNPDTLAEGESIPCNFSWAVSGSCTPCLFDIGECGEEAWDQYRTIPRS